MYGWRRDLSAGYTELHTRISLTALGFKYALKSLFSEERSWKHTLSFLTRVGMTTRPSSRAALILGASALSISIVAPSRQLDEQSSHTTRRVIRNNMGKNILNSRNLAQLTDLIAAARGSARAVKVVKNADDELAQHPSPSR